MKARVDHASRTMAGGCARSCTTSIMGVALGTTVDALTTTGGQTRTATIIAISGRFLVVIASHLWHKAIAGMKLIELWADAREMI
jgi:hypothetical protein